VVRDGRLLGVAPPSGEAGWPAGAVTEALRSAGISAEAVEQVALAVTPGALAPLRRRRAARRARAALGSRAAFVGRGLVGTGLPRAFDRSDRVSLHPPARCLAACAYYTAGARVVLVFAVHEGAVTPFLGTSGKVVPLAASEPVGSLPAVVARWTETIDADRVRVVGAPPLGGAEAAPFDAPTALAVGAAWLGRADERQGAWVPAPWRPGTPGD
jgi:hypothetical protein